MGDLLEKYNQANNRLILLDYDGTLVDFKRVPEEAVPSIELLDILRKLSSKRNTKLIIISGRIKRNWKIVGWTAHWRLLQNMRSVEKTGGNGKNWKFDIRQWKEPVLAILNESTMSCPGSFIEEKNFSLAWHYRNAETGYDQSRKLLNRLYGMSSSFHCKILDGNKVVEIADDENWQRKSNQKISLNTTITIYFIHWRWSNRWRNVWILIKPSWSHHC